MEKDENVKEAYKRLKYLSKDEDMRRIAELKEKARRDAYGVEQFNIQKGLEKGMKEGIEQGFKQGIEQGFKQGIQKDRIDIAKKMLKENMDDQAISKVTELTVEEINKLK